MASDVAVILRGEGEMVAGVTVKSRVTQGREGLSGWGGRGHTFSSL